MEKKLENELIIIAFLSEFARRIINNGDYETILDDIKCKIIKLFDSKNRSLDEIILEIIKDLESGVYNNGHKLQKVKKNLIWGQLFKKMNQSIDNLLNNGEIEKVDCCSNVSYKIKS